MIELGDSPPPVRKTFAKMESFFSNREIGGVKREIVKAFKNDFINHNFCQKDIREHTGCVNSLQLSHNERFLASGGDDMFNRVWIVDEMMMRRSPKPKAVMAKKHTSNIFAQEFDLEDRFLYSGERNGIVYKHDIETKQIVYTSKQNASAEDVYHLHQNPSDKHLMAVTRSSLITFIDDRDRLNPIEFLPERAADRRTYGKYYSAQYHPETPRLLLVNAKSDGPDVYDMRNPVRPLFDRAQFRGLPERDALGLEWMAGTWSPSGNGFLSLRSNAQPLFFDLVSKRCFILNSDRYMNMHTIKSMTFIDEYTVATGSDGFAIHVWRVPHSDDENSFLTVKRDENRFDFVVDKEIAVLRGHRSIPNQVQYSTQNQLLFSSGVENLVKLWSDTRLPWSYDIPFERKKLNEYDTDRAAECAREEEERRLIEDALDRDGEMEGRATWDDVFGGNVQTAEDRGTLEQFDGLIDGGESSDDEDFRMRIFNRRNNFMRILRIHGEGTDNRVEIHDLGYGVFRPIDGRVMNLLNSDSDDDENHPLGYMLNDSNESDDDESNNEESDHEGSQNDEGSEMDEDENFGDDEIDDDADNDADDDADDDDSDDDDNNSEASDELHIPPDLNVRNVIDVDSDEEFGFSDHDSDITIDEDAYQNLENEEGEEDV